jgi:predicted RNA-binding Zn-ribbon protein involved in translation (DUF1610 family)
MRRVSKMSEEWYCGRCGEYITVKGKPCSVECPKCGRTLYRGEEPCGHYEEFTFVSEGD